MDGKEVCDATVEAKSESCKSKGVSKAKLSQYLGEVNKFEDVDAAMAKVFEEISDDDALKRTIKNIEAIFEQEDFSYVAPPVPQQPICSDKMGVRKRLKKIQRYIDSFEYNHIGREFIHVHKNRPSNRIMEIAREILAQAWPIKCLEAVAVGVLLTKDMPEVTRFALRFKSRVDGHTYWHIVLGLKYNNKFGCLGLSRRSTLGPRDVRYETLSELVYSYREAYEEVGHKVRKITVGLPYEYDSKSVNHVYWAVLVCGVPKKMDWQPAMKVIDLFGKNLRKMDADLRRAGCLTLPDTVWIDNVNELHFIPPSHQQKLKEAEATNANSPVRGTGVKAISKLKSRRNGGTAEGSQPAKKSTSRTRDKKKKTERDTVQVKDNARAALGV